MYSEVFQAGVITLAGEERNRKDQGAPGWTVDRRTVRQGLTAGSVHCTLRVAGWNSGEMVCSLWPRCDFPG